MDLGKLGQYRSWLLSAGIVVAVVVWLATGIETEQPAPSTDAAPRGKVAVRASVRIRRQVAEEVVRTIRINGRTAPARTVQLNAETDGRVVATGIERGERVDEGGVIVRLDERDRLARLAQAEATVRQRELEYEARQRLKNESYVSEAQLQEAAAMLEAAKAELKRAELDIDYMTVRAPFDGALQERQVEIGDFVKAGDPIATIVDERRLIVGAAVSEYEAGHVHIGQPASAVLATGETVEGKIRYLAPVADDATRTFTVELELDNSAGALKAGVSAEMRIPAETVLAHKVAPSLLTLDDEGNVGIKVVNDAGRVEFYPADVALSSDEGVYVAGLPGAATIITVGQGFVTEGSLVDTVPESDVETAVAIKTEQQDR